MKRKLTFLISAAVMLLTMIATTGEMWGQSDYSTTYTSGVTLSTTGGTSASTCKVIVTGTTEYDGIKAGTSKVAGAMVITVPSGTKYLHIHAAAWNNESVTLSVTPNTNISPYSISLTADSGVSGSGSTYTLGTSANASTNYYKVITFTNALTANTNLTFTASSGKRFVIWGVNAEEAGSPSTPSITANNVDIAYDATQGSIAYTLNNGTGNVTASVTTGDWLTLGEVTSNTVPFTCAANTAAAARTATVTLSFAGASNKVVTVTQAGNPNIVNNISDITAAGNYTVKGTIVAKSTRGFVLGDGTGYVYYYKGSAVDQNIGDIVKLSGAVSAASNYKVFQFTNTAVITTATESNYEAEDPTVISGSDMDGVVTGSDILLSNYVQYQGTLTVSGTYYNITSIDGATTAKGSISYPTSTDFASLNGKVVTVTGYYVGVSSSQYYNTMIGSIEEVITSVAAPTFNPVAGAYTGTQSVTISCETEGSTIYYTTDGTTPTNESTQYIAAIQVSETTTIKAIAYVGSSASTVATATYTITQPLNTIEAIFAAATSTETNVIVTINNWVVSGVSTNGKNVYITDGTNGLIVYYTSDMSATFSAGNILSGENVSCKLKLYNGAAELLNVNAADLTITTGGTVTPADIEMANLSGVNTGALLHYDGLTCTVDNNKYYLTDGTTSLQLYNALFAFSNPVSGKVYNITGVYVQYNNTKEIMPRSAADIVEVAVPSITLAQYEYNLNADGGDAELPVSYTNMPANPQAVVIFYEANGETPLTENPTWITAEINDNYNIAGHIDVNEGEARSAYFKVKGKDANNNDVYSNLITINQASAGPNIEFNNTSMTLAAGGESDRQLNFDYSGLGNNPTFTINYYEQNGTTAATYNHDWLTATITDDKLNVTAGANTGDARTVYLKVYGVKNENVHAESNLVTITQAAQVVDYATLPFEWEGGPRSEFEALTGTSTYSVGDYGDNQGVYRMKLDGNGDYIQVKTNEQPGIVSIGVKMIGGATTSTLTVQGSADGTTFTNVEALTISGSQNDELTLTTTNDFAATDRYVRLLFTKGSNVGVGPITIAQVDNTPSITLNQYTYNLNADGGDAVLPVTTANLAANPQLAVVFYESDGATTTSYGWISATINNAGNIAGHIDENEGEARTAYFKVSGLANDNTTTVYSNLVTITQATPSAPSIVFGTASMSLEAGGESDRQLNFDYSGLGNNPTFTINYYEQNGTTAATYNHDWLTATITDDKLNVTAGANTGDARTVYLKVYGVKNENVHAESNLVTITQAAQVVDYATLPFEWEGGPRSEFEALTGTSTYSVGDYGDNQGVYRMKLDGNGDYIQVKTNEQPGIVSIGVKMIGGATTSTLTVQGSADGTTFTNVEALTISGSQNDELTLTTTNDFAATDRYVRLLFTKGSNVGVGPITIAQVDNTPSITADDVNIAYDATGGSISYTINNPVEGGSMSSTPTSGGDWLTVVGPSNGSVALTCEQNTGAERTATVRLTYTYNTNQTVIKDVTVTQEGAPAPTFIVSFTVGNDGIFVPNDDFTDEIVEIEAGTYHLPSATKEGFDFTGWSDGNTTYEADAEYTVSDDVDFTAQWTESTNITGTIAFGSAQGSTPINSTNVTGDDNLGNEWTITTVFSGETSFTQNASYSQIGASSKPATSITFTMTLPQQKTISAFEAKFGGFSNTAGDITLKVGDVNVGSGSLNATNDVTVQATNTTEVGTVLTVTVTNIAKGVKCYYISYTLSPAPVVPTINATSGDNLAYDATSGSIIYEIENYEEGTMEAASDADWISNIAVEEDDEMGEVTFNVTENTSNESRSATVTLTFTYDNDKTATANVTVTQNGQPGQPSITVDPESAVVVSDGDAPEFTITYASIAIANANDFDVQFYESNGTSTTTQPSWISDLTISGNTTDGFTLTVTVDANTSAERAAYLKVYALDGDDIIYSNLITISQNEYIPPATYTLVTDIDQVVSGKHYIIASSAEDGPAYAMGAQNNNNRAGVAVTVSEANITQTGNVYEFVINGPNDGKYTIYDKINSGYLYAASSSSNYLKTETELDNDGRWSISVANTGVATIIANGTNTRNNMRYNSSSKIFSCYSSGQSDVYLYVKDDDTELEYYGDPVSLAASAFDFTHNTYSVGGTMTITGAPVVANDPSSLIIQDGAQLIHESPINATVQNGVTAAPSWTSNVGGGWYFIASPVDDAVIAESILVEPFDLYKYDEPEAMWYAYNGDGDPFTTMERGIGYLHASADDQILAFAGTMIGTKTEITKPLSYACTYGDLIGYNLMGNPYTLVLEYGDMKIGGVNVTSFLSLNDAGTEYVTCNLQDNARIRPCQGFFIQATGPGQNLVFNPAKKDKSEIGLISIKAGNEEFMDKAYIQIGGGNTLRKIAFSDNNMVYVMDGDDDYAAMTIYELANPIPVHFVAAEPGTYTITVNAKNIDLDYMHLVDEFTNEHIDLLSEPTYTFTSAEGDKPGRFTIVFGIDNVEENLVNDVFAYQYEDELVVDGNGTLQIFDVLGRFVGSHEVHGSERISLSSFNTGVYVLRMVGENVKTQKIVVR